MLSQLWYDSWVTIFIVLVLVGIFAGQGLVIGFGAMGLLIAGVSWLWNRLSMEEVSYERHLSDRRAFIGDEVEMTVSLVNRKPLPLPWVRIEDELPDRLELLDTATHVASGAGARSIRHATSIAWYERVSWRHRIRCTQRGFYRIGPARIWTGDLFGFFETERTAPDRDYLLVYPRVVPLEELGMPAARPLGEARGGMRIYQDPSRPMGLREYRVGDPLKTVDWKATARRGELQVRTYEPSSSLTVILAVVVETTAYFWEGYSAQDLEMVITAAASVAHYAHRQGYSLGLFSNGTPLLAERPMRIAPSTSPDQITVILEALATVRPLPMGPMDRQMMDYARRFPLGATLVVVAAYVSPALAEALGVLRRRGHGVVLVYVGAEPLPDLPEGVVLHRIRDYLLRLEMAQEFGPAGAGVQGRPGRE